jgi:CheY-like chemotaxis protein
MALILVVDDESAVRSVLRRFLEHEGHEVLEAETAEAALYELQEAATHVAVAFCDVQMPGHDGLWLTSQIRTQYPATAVILATGVTDIPAKISMQHGVMAYLLKPFKRDLVASALAQALAWHDDAQQHGAPAMPDNLTYALRDWLDEIDGGLGLLGDGSQ